MNVELVNTGSELMRGFTLNTHQQWLCRKLADLGHVVTRQVTVGDSGIEIAGAVSEALQRADLVITTGGLGPTCDDRTREFVARLIGKALREDASVLERIEEFFRTRERLMPAASRIQALVPEGAIVLPNPHGTAPGFALELNPNPFRSGSAAWLIMLPGPPRELHPMFTASVQPLLKQVAPVEACVCRVLKTTGLGESFLEEELAGPLRALVAAGLDLGYCGRPGEVEIRLAAHGADAAERVTEAEQIVRQQIGEYIFASDSETLEGIIVRLLADRKETLALAESCTGGLLAHRLTNVPGASEVFLSGVVTYGNESKQRLLGVREETLREHGAVSEATAREMAEGARQSSGTDFAIAVTGIAGPGGGTTAKPVGTAFIALASSAETVVRREMNPYDRETFKYVTSQQALELLRRHIG